jgi:hypothetical protein
MPIRRKNSKIMLICRMRQGKVMKKPTALRRRYIPYEATDISDDEMLYRNDGLLKMIYSGNFPPPVTAAGNIDSQPG